MDDELGAERWDGLSDDSEDFMDFDDEDEQAAVAALASTPSVPLSAADVHRLDVAVVVVPIPVEDNTRRYDDDLIEDEEREAALAIALAEQRADARHAASLAATQAVAAAVQALADRPSDPQPIITPIVNVPAPAEPKKRKTRRTVHYNVDGNPRSGIKFVDEEEL